MPLGRRKEKVERRDERYETSGLECPMGRVVDLSASGARIDAGGKPHVRKGDLETFVLRTTGDDPQEVRLVAEVAWVRGKQFGVRFVNIEKVKQRALVDLATLGMFDEEVPRGAAREDVETFAKMEIEDLYAILGVARDASDEQIREAYRTLARVHHPDMSSAPDAEAVFARIAKAYAILRSTRRRREYDAMLGRAA